MPDVTRNLNKSSNQSFTYDAIGHAEDLSPVLTNINVDEAVFLSRFGDAGEAMEPTFSWLTKGLRPAQDNAHLEYEKYEYHPVGSIEGLSNNVQYFQNTGMISDVQNKSAKAYNNEHGTELDDAKFDAIINQSKDIEYMLINGEVKVDATKTTPPRSGGIPYFMNLNTKDVTVDSASGVFTTTDTNKLETGGIVYFIATKIPAGMKKNLLYYVRVDDTDPTHKFTIFDTQKGAVENIASVQIIPTDVGTKVQLVDANVVSLGGTSDFTLDDINTVMEMAFKRGGKPTEMFLSSSKSRRFSQLALAQTTTNRKSGETKIAMVATTYQGDFGTITANKHPLYPDNRIDIFDMQYWDNRYFDRTHEVPNLGKDGTYEKFVVETKMGLQATQPKASCSIIDIIR
jgi:hypothetical protein